ncbi:hypothetical protein [Phytoactinopolyspora alkaliphila]|nr:hypothetical protein [Phytoactinopolyspora alkaliphila]
MQALDGDVDLLKMLFGLLDKNSDLRPLEGDGRALRIVLVISVGVA